VGGLAGRLRAAWPAHGRKSCREGGGRDHGAYLRPCAGHAALVPADGCVSCQDQGRARRRAAPDGRGDAPGMARTKPWHRTAAEQDAAMASVARLHADVEAQRAAARRAIRARRASIDPPDEELILPLPTVLEAPSNHLTGRRRKTTLVLVVILATIATIAMGSGGALWKRERILIQFISSENKVYTRPCPAHSPPPSRFSLSHTHNTHNTHTPLLPPRASHTVQQPRHGWEKDPMMVGIRYPDGLVVGLAPATLEFWVWAPDPLMVGIRSPDGLVVGSCTSHPGGLGSIPKREEPGKTGRHPVLKYRFPHGSH
jgi:hypothetical protein